MKISIIGTAGIPAQYGGFETLAENLVKNSGNRIEYTVFCSTRLYPEKPEKYLNANLRFVKLSPNGISSIFYDLICMLLSLRSNIMLVLGVSGSLFLPFIRFLYQGKIITNVDGIEWKRNKWNKMARLILRLSEKSAIKFSHAIIADNQGIVDYITGNYKQKTKLIEYGGDHVVVIKNISCKKYHAITVCRIEPENNIHIILKAFSEQRELFFAVVGNWKSSKYGIKLYKEYSNFSHIHLLDPIYEPEKINDIRSNAFIYIHGHSAGGTNPSLVEAMYLGFPVLAFDCVYNRYTTENKSLYWSNADELYAHIVHSNKSELDVIGRNMKEIAKRRHNWKKIVAEYEVLYAKVSKN